MWMALPIQASRLEEEEIEPRQLALFSSRFMGDIAQPDG
jgi:hypothetical protein